MKKIFISLLGLFIGLSVFIFLIFNIGWETILEAFLVFPVPYFLILLILTIFTKVFKAWRWKFVFKTYGLHLPLSDLFKITMASSSIAYLTPSIILEGEAIEAVSFNEIFSIPWSKNIAIILTQKILEVSAFLLFLVLGIFIFLFFGNIPTHFSIIVAGGVTALLISLVVIFYFKAAKRESFLVWLLGSFGFKKEEFFKNANGKILLEIEQESFHFFNPKRKSLWAGLGIVIFEYFLYLSKSWLLIFFLTGETNFFKVLATFGFLNLAFLLPLPAAIGTQEATQMYAFSTLGLGAQSGLVFSLILRGIDIIVFLIGLIFLLKLGMKLFKQRILKMINGFFKKT